MKTKWIAVTAWLLVGVLLVSGAGLWIGKRSSETFPSANSVDPSGLQAFQDALKTTGAPIVVDRRGKPQIQPTDLVIVSAIGGADFSLVASAEPKPSPASNFNVREHVRNGGTAVLLSYPPNFKDRTALSKSEPEVVTLASGVKKRITPGGEDFSKEFDDAVPSPYLEIAKGESWLAVGRVFGKGKVLAINDATLITNRFIAAHDNAEVVLGLVQNLVQPDRRIVFIERDFNRRDPSLLDVLGPETTTAFYQCLFVLFVIAWSLGKRFGEPDAERVAQRGNRDLLLAIRDTYARAQRHDAAIQTSIDRAEAVIRKRTRCDISLLNYAKGHPALDAEYRRLLHFQILGAPPEADWLEAIQTFETEVEETFKTPI